MGAYDCDCVNNLEYDWRERKQKEQPQSTAGQLNDGARSTVQSTDLIDRQQAIDALMAAIDDVGILDGADIKVVFDNLPPAQPERAEGKWVYGEDSTADCVDGYRCSQCGFFVPWDYNHKLIDYINDYAYCPHCGAKMKGAQNG